MPTHSQFAVFDCETTGFGKNDRIVEIAVVLMSGKNLEVVDEFDTLVNPQRDVGKTQIHGITAGMVSAAPTIEEILPSIEKLITGSVLVAHNLPFDIRMFKQECVRSNALFNEGSGLCTYKMSGANLVNAANNLGLEVSHHHRAIEDARLASEIFRALFESEAGTPAVLRVSNELEHDKTLLRTLRREAVTNSQSTPLRRLLGRSCIPSSSDSVAEYFAVLDVALGDLTLSSDESIELKRLQGLLNIEDSRIQELHVAYLDSVVRAALRDDFLSTDEINLVKSLADLLSIDSYELPIDERSSETPDLAPGTRVCFTGEFVGSDGRFVSRDQLELLAAKFGLQPVSNVSRKGCDAVLAADPSSQSGKCKKAREFGIPVIAVVDFIRSTGRAV